MNKPRLNQNLLSEYRFQLLTPEDCEQTTVSEKIINHRSGIPPLKTSTPISSEFSLNQDAYLL